MEVDGDARPSQAATTTTATATAAANAYAARGLAEIRLARALCVTPLAVVRRPGFMRGRGEAGMSESIEAVRAPSVPLASSRSSVIGSSGGSPAAKAAASSPVYARRSAPCIVAALDHRVFLSYARARSTSSTRRSGIR